MWCECYNSRNTLHYRIVFCSHCPLIPAVKPSDLCKIHQKKASLEKSHHLTGSEHCKVINDQPLQKGKKQNCAAFPVQSTVHFHFCLYSCLYIKQPVWKKTKGEKSCKREESLIQCTRCSTKQLRQQKAGSKHMLSEGWEKIPFGQRAGLKSWDCSVNHSRIPV